MIINSARLIYFSPTRTTMKVVEGIARAFPVNKMTLDLTLPGAETREPDEIRDELAVIGAPVYVGRIPALAAGRLRRIKAHGVPAVVVVVYGNRAYEDALLELKNLASEAGFVPVAGAAFIGEHSANYALGDGTPPIAKGRPDEADEEKALRFGGAVWDKLKDIAAPADAALGRLPGNFPYVEKQKLPAASPATDETLCGGCGTCASVCPAGAITIEDEVMTDAASCIMCSACVANCPTGARKNGHTWMRKIGEWLSANYRARKEPETFGVLPGEAPIGCGATDRRFGSI